MPVQDVQMVSISGPAMDALKLAWVANLAISFVLITLLVALCVVVFWRGG